MISLQNLYGKLWMKVLAAGLLLACLNVHPLVHRTIINLDTQVAIKMNSIVGVNPIFDQTIGWLSTRMGDAFMLICLCVLFLIHAICGSNLNERIRRISFWIWLGLLCLITYFLSSVSESFIKRDTPILAIHPFRNLQPIYGIVFRSCPTSSFPSGHGLAYLFFSIMAWRRYFAMSLMLWFLTLVMLSLRLIVGLHWLSDIVLGSLFLAVLLASLINGTSLKNTYRCIQKGILFALRSLFSKSNYDVLIGYYRLSRGSGSTNYFELHGRH